MPTTVVIAEDHAITRQGLRILLERHLDATVVGEAEDGLAAMRLVEAQEPELLILDLSLPGLNGLDVLEQVQRRVPQTRAIVLSMYGEDQYVIQALKSGALAYVLKGSAADELIAAAEQVLQGRLYLSSELPESLRERARQANGEILESRYASLTEREREVLQLVAEGYTSQEIGDRLFISRRTVDKHRENLMAKLELRNQAELVRYALQRGLIPDGPSGSDL